MTVHATVFKKRQKLKKEDGMQTLVPACMRNGTGKWHCNTNQSLAFFEYCFAMQK